MELSHIRKVKRGKGDGLWGSYVVERDDLGLWLFTPAESRYRATNGTEVSWCYAGWPDPPGAPVIHLIPTDGWWFARWQDTPPGAHVAIDICTPSRLQDGIWSYDDLELDVFKFTDGRFGLVDEDEFDESRQAGHISDDEALIARETAEMLEQRVSAWDELFDELGWQKLNRYLRESLTPITELPG